MANIQSYLDQIANAVYGEEIRSSIINSLQKVNDDNDSYADLKKEVIAARDDINDQVDQFDKKMEVASEISKKLEEDTASGNQTHSDLTNSITTAQSERSKLESAYENVGKVVESANEKKDALDVSLSSANTAKKNLDGSVTTATTTEKSLDETIQTSEQRKKNLDSSITSANKIFSNLNDAITSANNAKSNLTQVTDSADSAKTALSEVIDSATATKSIMDASVKSATTANTNLSESIKNATTAKNTLQGVIDSASEIKGQLDSSNTTAVTSKNSGNYENIGFTLPSANGYISAIGYSTKYDWLFLPSEVTGNSSLPVGDYYYQNNTWNGYRIALLGGVWSSWVNAGGFYWYLDSGVGSRVRYIGGRLVYIPTRDSATYTAAIEAWKQKMAA